MVEEQAKTIAELEKSLAIAQKERDLEKRENELNQRILQIKDQEIAALSRSFDRIKEIGERSLRLAEIGKPKANWEIQGLLGLAAFGLGFIAGR